MLSSPRAPPNFRTQFIGMAKSGVHGDRGVALAGGSDLARSRRAA